MSFEYSQSRAFIQVCNIHNHPSQKIIIQIHRLLSIELTSLQAGSNIWSRKVFISRQFGALTCIYHIILKHTGQYTGSHHEVFMRSFYSLRYCHVVVDSHSTVNTISMSCYGTIIHSHYISIIQLLHKPVDYFILLIISNTLLFHLIHKFPIAIQFLYVCIQLIPE